MICDACQRPAAALATCANEPHCTMRCCERCLTAESTCPECAADDGPRPYVPTGDTLTALLILHGGTIGGEPMCARTGDAAAECVCVEMEEA